MRHIIDKTSRSFIPGFLAVIMLTGFAHAFPLDSVFARGDSCISVVWTPESINTRSNWYVQYGSLCTGVDSVYRHCDFLPGVTYSSIAYSYGGEDPYTVFSQKIRQGYLVGSHLCHYNNYGDPSPVVAGTDCSGFVCYIWNVPRVATGTLVSKYTSIKRSDLSPGDILVKSGSHTVLVVDKDDATHLLIWESTSAVNGCRERMIDLNDTYWSPYVPIRNTDIVKTSVSGSLLTHNVSSIKVLKKNGDIFFYSQLPENYTLSLYAMSGEKIPGVVNKINLSTVSFHPLRPLHKAQYLICIENGSNVFTYKFTNFKSSL